MTSIRRHTEEPFDIHEDARTEETEVMAEDDVRTEEAIPPTEELEPDTQEEEGLEEEDDDAEESSEDEAVDRGVQDDMDKLQSDFPGFRDKYRLIKRIGEGKSLRPLLLEEFRY